MRILTKFLPSDPDLPILHSTDLLRQVSKIVFAKNMCKHAPRASMHMYFTTFPFFFTLSAFKNRHNRNKKKPQGPHYWITKQCVWETPLWSFKRVKRKMPCTYSTAAGILVKGDTKPEPLEWWLCSWPEAGEWPESLGSWLAGRRGGQGGVEGQRAEKTTGLRREVARVDLLLHVSIFQARF